MTFEKLDKCGYNCGDLICGNGDCDVYNDILRCFLGDENITPEKLLENYNRIMEYEGDTLDYKSIVESLIAHLLQPNIQTYYGYKDLVKIK